jgi:uncharacterized HAD superfamily protein
MKKKVLRDRGLETKQFISNQDTLLYVTDKYLRVLRSEMVSWQKCRNVTLLKHFTVHNKDKEVQGAPP